MSADIQLRRVDASAPPPGTLLRVRHTLLPMAWWRSVPVFRDVYDQLTVFEMYLLEMALTLGSVSEQDTEEVLGLSQRFLDWGAWRLAVAGALRRDGAVYHVVPAEARKLQRAGRLPRRESSTADFVLLPRTGDLLAVAPGRGRWLAEADRRQRNLWYETAPTPPELWKRGRAEYLAERIRLGNVSGSDTRIAGVTVPESRDQPLLRALKVTLPEPTGNAPAVQPLGCHAYHCTAEVRDTGVGRLVEATFIDRPVADDGNNGADGDSGDRADEAASADASRRHREARAADEAPLTADLTGADSLVTSWLQQLDALDSPANVAAAWRLVVSTDCGYQRAERTGASAWVYYVDGKAAGAIAASGQSLAEPAGLEIGRAETTLEVHVRLAPTDDKAAALFARDRAVGSLVAAADDVVAQLAPVCAAALGGLEDGGRSPGPHERAMFTEAAVRKRLWQLGLYRVIYRLREPEDFGYE
jgi:hypothetical protein